MSSVPRIRSAYGARSTAREVVANCNLRGRNAIVTGGASGIGIETARALAEAGAEVVLAVRRREAGCRVADAINAGLETHRIGGTPLNIYSAARTVVDCFKFRNKIGLDVALEALRLARQRKRVQNRELLRYARLLRVENPMSPYLQAIQ